MKLLKNKTDEFYSPWPMIIYFLLCLSLAGTLLFFILYAKLQIDWIESIAITFFTTTYHIGIRLLSPVILSLLFHKKYDYHHSDKKSYNNHINCGFIHFFHFRIIISFGNKHYHI